MATLSKVARQHCSKSWPMYHQPYTMSKKNIHMLYCKQYNYSNTIFLNFLLDWSVKCWTVHSIVMAATTIFSPNIHQSTWSASHMYLLLLLTWLLGIKVSHNVQTLYWFHPVRYSLNDLLLWSTGKSFGATWVWVNDWIIIFGRTIPLRPKHQNHLEKFWN